MEWGADPAEALLYDAGGRFVKKVMLEAGLSVMVTTTGLSPGDYFVTIDGSQRLAARLIVLP